MKVVKVTPFMAAQMMEQCNRFNRPMDIAKVARFATFMKKGLWKLSASSRITISPKGTVMDGHHRLHAVIASNTTQLMVIAEGSEGWDELQDFLAGKMVKVG